MSMVVRQFRCQPSICTSVQFDGGSKDGNVIGQPSFDVTNVENSRFLVND